jgi:hypothetical protein
MITCKAKFSFPVDILPQSYINKPHIFSIIEILLSFIAQLVAHIIAVSFMAQLS